VLNIRSQKAIQKIGGMYEGTFRNDLIRTNGTHRDSMYFSIVDRDWPMAKLKLRELI
jgi:N-acetyltransferase